MKARACVLLSRLLLAVLLCAPLLCDASGKGWKPSELPNPQLDPGGVCGRRGLKSAVCSPDGLLSPSELDALDGVINFIAEGTHGYSLARCGARVEGFQVAVAVVDRMSFWFDAGAGASAKAGAFARALHDAWGVGDAECENGVVLFAAVGDRAMHISTGRGARALLTDARARAILRDMRPLMRDAQYGRALLAAVQAAGRALSGDAPPPEDALSWASTAMLAVFGACFACSCCAGARESLRRRRRFRRCQAALARIDRDSEQARRNAFGARACPICLEDFAPEDAKQKPPTQAEPAAGDAAADTAADAADGTARLLPSERAAPGAEVGGTPGAAGEAPGPRVALACGHVFHAGCIAGWAGGDSANRRLCPVCRRAVDGGAGDDRSTAAEGSDDARGFSDERRFRIRRAHDLYPEYVSYALMNRFQEERHAALAEHADFARLDPAVMAQARAAGQHGSSFSFGGGSSAGGGGGGSSW